MDASEPHPLQWTIEDYYHLCECEWFQDRRVQLIGGQLLEWPPDSNHHSAAISLAGDELRRAFGAGFWVRVKASLNISAYSVPDPDLAVLPGNPGDYRNLDAPQTALLIAEVADATLAYDRGPKASLYAAAGIADYWIVNVVERCLEVYRDPQPDPAQPFGARYGSRVVLAAGEAVAPLAAPQGRVAVADLLP
jgi:Uma2 family endonuclease